MMHNPLLAKDLASIVRCQILREYAQDDNFRESDGAMGYAATLCVVGVSAGSADLLFVITTVSHRSMLSSL